MMDTNFKKQLDKLEETRYQNKQNIKRIMEQNNDVRCHIVEGNRIISIVYEGYRGTTAAKYFEDKNDSFQKILDKNEVYTESKKDEYIKINRELYDKEEEIIRKQRKEQLEGEQNDNRCK